MEAMRHSHNPPVVGSIPTRPTVRIAALDVRVNGPSKGVRMTYQAVGPEPLLSVSLGLHLPSVLALSCAAIVGQQRLL
jgi:hypothetical protein